ncbi:hypothetical protein GCM10020295_01120 [Streptomyces cinereospinus]
MGEEPLDDPPLGQRHAPFLVVAAFDDRQDQDGRCQAVLDEVAGVAAVGPNEGKAMVCLGHLLRQDPGSGAVADIRGGDHHAQQQAEGVDHDVPLAAVDELAAVEAAAVRTDDGVRLDGPRVDHPGCRLRLPPQLLADPRVQPVVELLDQGGVAPTRMPPPPSSTPPARSPASPRRPPLHLPRRAAPCGGLAPLVS